MSARRLSSPLDKVAELAGSLPIYLSVAPAVASWRADLVHDWLGSKYPAARFALSRGLYGSFKAWYARWLLERTRYGGGVVLTAAEDIAGEQPTGGAIDGLHMLNDCAAQEVIDLFAMARPVAWVPISAGRYREIATFAIEQPEWIDPGYRFARLFYAVDARPFVPVIGHFHCGLPLPIAPIVAAHPLGAVVAGHGG